MITVGLDFGTHQTKVCIEDREGMRCSYSFMKFKDEYGDQKYTLPSVITIDKDGLLSYGYRSTNNPRKIIHYFKQATFRSTRDSLMSINDAMLYSIWYLANILFDLEKLYGQDFVVQMGVPTDSEHLGRTKATAVQVIASAYRLVEDVFEMDKQKFLNSTYSELIRLTQVVAYSKEVKNKYGVLVFPEAYACLKPLTSKGKIANGMSLMVDIGGGTTDISFFAINNGVPQVYGFYSINKGLNYLASDSSKKENGLLSSSVVRSFDKKCVDAFSKDIMLVCSRIVARLKNEFPSQAIPLFRLREALENRPIVYSGGGSTYGELRKQYLGFKDTKLVSHRDWDIRAVTDVQDIINNGLCPILSTAYGLAISVVDDKIEVAPFGDIFKKIRETVKDNSIGQKKEPRKQYYENTAVSVYDDWDAMK